MAGFCFPVHETVGRVYIKEFVTGALHHSDPGDEAVRVNVHAEHTTAVHMRSTDLVWIGRCVYFGKHRQDRRSSRIGDLGTRREQGCCRNSSPKEENCAMQDQAVSSEREGLGHVLHKVQRELNHGRRPRASFAFISSFNLYSLRFAALRPTQGLEPVETESAG